MKNISLLTSILLAGSMTSAVGQQVTAPPALASNTVAGLAATVPGLGTWQATPRDFNSTDWQRVQIRTNSTTGQWELQTNRYTELANNLNFTNSRGALEVSADSISLMTNTGGAAALRGPTKVYFPPSLGGANGAAIRIVSPTSTTLKIRPLALYYFDSQSGKSVLLASAQEAQGELVGVNQVVYKTVFSGCDLRITYTKGACESDLIMLVRPKAPEAYGLNSAFTRMELWHAVDGPAPRQTPTLLDSVTDATVRASMAEPDFIDQTLDFVDLHFPQGRAFSWNGLDATTNPDIPVQVRLPSGSSPGHVVVAKSWAQIGQTAALVESVQWTNIEPYLVSLPLMADLKQNRSKAVEYASLKRQIPVPNRRRGSPIKPMGFALGGYKAKGFVLDYLTLSGGYSSCTFTGGTYFISAFVSISSTATFNAGCCLKYASGASLYMTGPVICNGTAVNPSVFTSMHDNAFGSQIAGSTGYPAYSAGEAFWLSYATSPQMLNGLKIRWAQVGVEVDGPGNGFGHTLANSSIEWCQGGVYANSCGITLQNSTKCSVGTDVTGTGNWGYSGSLADICSGTDPYNGLPTSWEYKYFGASGVEPNADFDGDGLNTQQEYNNNGNPLVSDRPQIQGQPQNQNAVQGGGATFTVSAAGLAPLAYQWSFNGVSIPGATGSRYVLSNVQLANSGYYSVVVNNICGSTASSAAFLSMATSGGGVPQGIVAWWPAENNTTDTVGGNNGTWYGSSSTYALGYVGQAFQFNGSSSYVQVNDPPSTLELDTQLTIEFWMQRLRTTPAYEYLVEKGGDWNYGQQNYAMQIHGPDYGLCFTDNGGYWITGGTGGTIADQNWHHCAVTAISGQPAPILYIDGQPRTITQSSGGSINLFTSARPLHIGAQIDPVTGWNYYGDALVDELSIYSRALTANEISAIFNAGHTGKVYAQAPTITSPPVTQTVGLGANPTFSVVATGTAPLSYQWTLNGVAISGASGSSYTVAGVQTANTGSYGVVVANTGGSAFASASLFIAGNCTPQSPNLISFWRAEGTPNDTVGSNNGQLVGGATYGPGWVNQAFSFNGSGAYVQVPSTTSLQLSGQFTLEFWYEDTGSSGYYGLVAKRAQSYPYPCNYGINVLAGDHLQVYFLDPTTAVAYQVSSISPLPTVGAFHHLAAVFQQITSSQVQIQTYIDGALRKSDTFNGTLSGTFDNSPVTIGASNSTGEWFKGLIDEVSIYSRVLSSSEIQALYYAGTAGKCFDLNYFWFTPLP